MFDNRFSKKLWSRDLIALLSESWSRSGYQFHESSVVSLDITKAFDRTWHDTLLVKLRACNVSDIFNRSIAIFVSDRIISVVMDRVSYENNNF